MPNIHEIIFYSRDNIKYLVKLGRKLYDFLRRRKFLFHWSILFRVRAVKNNIKEYSTRLIRLKIFFHLYNSHLKFIILFCMFALFFVIIKFYKIKHKIFSITIERTITFNVSFSKLSRNILTFPIQFQVQRNR